MELNDANLAKTLECPVCLDVFDEPKLLSCGHTVCQKCVNNVVAAHPTAENAGQGHDENSVKCPECGMETVIPPGGLKTNYRLVDLVCRAQKTLVDSHACNGCGEQAPIVKMFTCETCQETLNTKPLWFCSLCAMEQHRYHTTSKCNKATRQQIQEACHGIASSGSSAGMYTGLSVSLLNRAFDKETELISQLLNEQKRGFVWFEARVKHAENDLTQEDLSASLQEATDLEQKLMRASNIASEVGKNLESALRDYREQLEDIFPKGHYEELMEAEGNGTSRNNFDLSTFGDDEEAIELNECRVDVIPNLSRYTELEVLNFRSNLLPSINDNIVHATLTQLYLSDNQIKEIRGLDSLVNLETLDVGNNLLRKIQGLTSLVKLKHLCLEDNAIEKIEGLDTLVNLELLQLSGNRIKAIENIDSQQNLQRLYLGRNRIRKIENTSHLTKLRVLRVSGNRITKLENLDMLADLEALYVADQGIETFDGTQKLNNLKRIDADMNFITSLDHLDHLQQLEELYLFDNKISQWSEVDKLAKLAKLRTVVLSDNPIATQDHDDYRRKVIEALPQVTEVDNTPCR
ncbi:leucine Rich Repeat family protein [Aphelenchoides avenae]|nr:leucine Rich Repeat family protein [Aphelenchus avenae]